MSLKQTLLEYIAAAYSGLWLHTQSPEDAFQELVQMSRERRWSLCRWDFANGLRVDAAGMLGDYVRSNRMSADTEKLGGMLRSIPALSDIASGRAGATAAVADADRQRLIVVLENVHRDDVLRTNSLYPQLLQDLVVRGRTAQWHIVLLSPVVNLPPELDRYFTVVEHGLPTKDELWQIAEGLDDNYRPPTEPEKRAELLAAAAGMTRLEAENAFALAAVRGKPFDPPTIWDEKAKALAKSGLLELYTGSADMANLGGVDYARDFCCRLLASREDPALYARGVMLLGVSGGGKSEFAKALGNFVRRRVLMMNVGQLRSKWQGETDRNMKQALATADAMSPCILVIDEVEKALAGVSSSGQTDGGTGSRVLGTLLSWMNDRTSDVFLVCTCNSLERLTQDNPEFVRAERFDGIFFFDLPDNKSRQTIWDIYLKVFYGSDYLKSSAMSKVSLKTLVEMSADWTGAEIKAAARLSRILERPLDQAGELVVPVAQTSTTIDYIRNWADGLCFAADRPGRYRSVPVLEQERAEVRRRVLGQTAQAVGVGLTADAATAEPRRKVKLRRKRD